MKRSAFQRILAMGKGDGLRAQLIRNAMGVGGLKLLSVPMTLVTSILLARGLGPSGYGQYAFVMAVVTMLALPIAPGLGQLITREVARYQYDGEWSLFRGLLRRAHQCVLIGSTFLIGGLVSIAATNANWKVDDRWTLLCIASVMLPLLGLNAMRSGALRGLRYVFYAQVSGMLARPGLHLLLAGTLLGLGLLNPATALVSQIASTTLALLVAGWLLSRCRPTEVSVVEPSYRHGEWSRAILPFTMLVAVSTLNRELGILILGWLGTAEQVAALRVAQSGGMVVLLSLSIVNMVIGPHVTRAHRDGDKAKLQQISRQSARAALVVSLPIALPLILLGDPIIRFVYGEAYAPMVTWPLAIMAAGQFVNVAFGSAGLFLTMSGYERDTLLGHVIALGTNCTAALVLIPLFDVVGAALAVAIGLLTWNVVLAVRFVQRLNLRPSAI